MAQRITLCVLLRCINMELKQKGRGWHQITEKQATEKKELAKLFQALSLKWSQVSRIIVTWEEEEREVYVYSGIVRHTNMTLCH